MKSVPAKYTLLVEDNPDEVVLAQLGFARARIPGDLMVVNDGQDALDYLFRRGKYEGREPREDPGLVLLDLNLPLVSGFEVLRETKSQVRTSRVPVVVLTSSTQERDRDESYRLGADDYICKPADFSQFVEILQGLKSRWLNPKGAGSDSS